MQLKHMKHFFTTMKYSCCYKVKSKRPLFLAMMLVLSLPSLLRADAIEDYTKAIALDPNYTKAYINRGIAYYMTGNMGRAVSDFRKACDMGLGPVCEYLQKFFRDM